MKRKILAFVSAVVMMLLIGMMPMQVEAAKSDTSTGSSSDSSLSTSSTSSSGNSSGGGCDSGGFLGFRAWYDGLPCENGAIKAPKGDATGASIAGFVWTIVANVLVDLFMVVGFLATGFLMYGGYLYIMSNGDPNKTASGMKTIKAAVIGLIIAILANVIIRTILVVLGL